METKHVQMFAYHSELTHRIIITQEDHGNTWEMPDGEVYDFVTQTEINKDIIMISGSGRSAGISIGNTNDLV